MVLPYVHVCTVEILLNFNLESFGIGIDMVEDNKQ